MLEELPEMKANTLTGVFTDEAVKEVELEGQTAAWIKHYGLVWETEEISYLVGGRDLSLEEAIRIARSLR